MRKPFKRILILLAAAAVLVLLGVMLYLQRFVPQEEGVAILQPVKMKQDSQLLNHISRWVFAEAKPVELIDLPGGLSESHSNSTFFILPLGDRQVFAVAQTASTGGVRLWIDTNLDRRLSDETAVTAKMKFHSTDKRSVTKYHDFGTLHVSGARFTSAPFHLTGFEECSRLLIQPANYMKGGIRLGSQTYAVALTDGNYDGKFGALYQPGYYIPWTCDTLSVGSNGLGWRDPVPLGRYFAFRRREFGPHMPIHSDENVSYYSVHISEDGTRLEMRPAELEMGTLKIGKNRRLLVRLFSEAATQWVNFRDEVQLPAGEYQVFWGEMDYTAENGGEHRLRPDFQEDLRKGRFTVRPGETVTMNPGPPFQIKTDIQKSAPDTLGVLAVLTGNENEEYGLNFSRTAKRPEIIILDETGQTLHSGSMEYG